MDSTVHLYILCFSSSLLGASSMTCEIKDQIICNYTVLCEGHAGSASNPSCDDPHVNFIMKNSKTDALTQGFFRPTNFDSRVSRIHAINNTWPNIEPFAFKYYSKCNEIDLSGNNIKNIKNEAFKDLFVLYSLNLSDNAIENLNPKSLVVSESVVNKINTLDLSYNLLTEISNEVLSTMSNLDRLYLEYNRIHTLADECFASLKVLTILDLRHNQLTSLNMSLINLKALLGLDLSHNHLIKLSGFELNRLGSLLFVNFTYNAIREIESNCFNQAFNILSIDLSNNKIESPIDSLMFINNNKLQHLNVRNNSISSIKDDTFSHNDLIHLFLEKNNVTGDITGRTFNGIFKVVRLDLFNQSITAIRKGAFFTATSLAYLNLSRNMIDTIEISSFPTMSSLNILDISHNKISDLEFLSGSLVGLTELYLNNNNLSAIKQDTFRNQTNLKILDLSMNFIVTIEQFALPLLNLQFLNVTGNFLQGNLKSDVLSPSKSLRYLDLPNFRFTKILDGAIVGSPLLARVNLSNNAIQYIESKNFINMENLYSLDLSYNKITTLQLNSSILINLKALYLNNNYLNHIAYSFANISKLLYIDISNNRFTDISDPIFQTFSELRVLRASNNSIKIFNNHLTNSLTKLMTLSLSSNYLVNLNLSYFPDLVNVELSNNSIGSINSTLFQNLEHLQSIDLSFNNISQLTPGTFQNLKILKLLNLSSNFIKTVRYGSFKGLGRAEVIDISRNMIQVLDVDIFHECTELKRLIIDYNFITSLNFERLVMTVTKLNSLSLGGNPISCKEIVRNYNTGLAGRRVEVTSISKVFEEDNVHGILCGAALETTSTTAVPTTESPASKSMAGVLFTWCTLLTILIVVIASAAFIYRRRHIVLVRNSKSRGNTTELGESHYQSDLLF